MGRRIDLGIVAAYLAARIDEKSLACGVGGEDDVVQYAILVRRITVRIGENRKGKLQCVCEFSV